MVGKDECWSPSVISAPALGDIESASTGEHGTKYGRETAEVFGARPGHLERHGVRPSGVDFDVPRGEVHCDVLFERWRPRSGDRTLLLPVLGKIVEEEVEELVELEASSITGERALDELAVLGGVLDLDADTSGRCGRRCSDRRTSSANPLVSTATAVAVPSIRSTRAMLVMRSWTSFEIATAWTRSPRS